MQTGDVVAIEAATDAGRRENEGGYLSNIPTLSQMAMFDPTSIIRMASVITRLLLRGDAEYEAPSTHCRDL